MHCQKLEFLTNIFVADSVEVSLFFFAQLSPKARRENLVKPTMKTDFSTKWHLKVIQGQAFYGYWKADKALHDAA